MAKKNDGLREKVAERLSGVVGSPKKTATRRTPKAVTKVASEIRELAGTIEDRAKGGPGKRSAAAKKAAATRKAAAAKRSASAKKGARTRAKAKAGR